MKFNLDFGSDWHRFELRMSSADAPLRRLLNRASSETSREVVELARSKARSSSPQLAAAAPSIRAKTGIGRIPAVIAGGGGVATSSGATHGDIFFGAEFGSWRFPQFPSPVRGGRSIYPAVEELGDWMDDEHLDAVERVW